MTFRGDDVHDPRVLKLRAVCGDRGVKTLFRNGSELKKRALITSPTIFNQDACDDGINNAIGKIIAVPDPTVHAVEIVGSATRPRTLQGIHLAPDTSRVAVTPSGIRVHIAVTSHGTTTTPSAFQAAYRISP